MGKAAGTAKADTAVKLVLMFFISLLSFSVGTYVGKQFSDSEARRAALEADYNDNEMETAVQDTGTQMDADAATAPVSDEEVASLTEEFVKNERAVASEKATEHAAADATHDTAQKDHDGYTHHSKMKATENEHVSEVQQAAAHAATATKKETHTDAPATHATNKTPTTADTAQTTSKAAPTHEVDKKMTQATGRVANDMAPAADVKKPREPSTVLPTVATTAIGKYTVQVASYATEAEAKDHASKLSSKGYSAFFVPATVNGKAWYRVSVGLFSDQKSASTFRTELLSTSAVSTAIVQKIVK